MLQVVRQALGVFGDNKPLVDDVTWCVESPGLGFEHYLKVSSILG
jgi:hypothetical protein